MNIDEFVAQRNEYDHELENYCRLKLKNEKTDNHDLYIKKQIEVMQKMVIELQLRVAELIGELETFKNEPANLEIQKTVMTQKEEMTHLSNGLMDKIEKVRKDYQQLFLLNQGQHMALGFHFDLEKDVEMWMNKNRPPPPTVIQHQQQKTPQRSSQDTMSGTRGGGGGSNPIQRGVRRLNNNSAPHRNTQPSVVDYMEESIEIQPTNNGHRTVKKKADRKQNKISNPRPPEDNLSYSDELLTFQVTSPLFHTTPVSTSTQQQQQQQQQQPLNNNNSTTRPTSSSSFFEEEDVIEEDGDETSNVFPRLKNKRL